MTLAFGLRVFLVKTKIKAKFFRATNLLRRKKSDLYVCHAIKVLKIGQSIKKLRKVYLFKENMLSSLNLKHKTHKITVLKLFQFRK